ncbi:MAG TPA: MFS transporter [Chthoniobacterales bacterium]|nr:MFS transporter [Chthoniobacterales bacterium]
MPAESQTYEAVDLRIAAVRKITCRLIPFLFVLYVVAWLDRVNVGFAALQMNADLKFSEAAFGLGSGVFFIGYCLFEVPSNLILARVGARLWISRIMITWGAISTGMMLVRTPAQFCVLRFLLGAAEAGFFPGVIYYLSFWYPQAERARAIAAFMTAVPVTGLIGGPLSGFLLELRGTYGLAGWQWLFLAEGVPAVLLGVIVLFYLPDRLETAHWLTPAERSSLLAELARENANATEAKRIGILAALTNSIIWRLGIIFLLAAIAFYGYSFWSPLVIKSLTGTSDLGVGFISGGISATTIFFMLINSAHSDQTDERPRHVALALLVMAIGCFGCAILRTPLLGILSLALVPIGHCSAYGPFWSIPSRFLSGGPAAAGTALVVTIANVGGFVGPALIGYLKQQSGTHTIAFLLLGAFGILGALLAYALRGSPALMPRNTIGSAA